MCEWNTPNYSVVTQKIIVRLHKEFIVILIQWADQDLTLKSKMAAVGHVENQLFSGLSYNPV